MNEPAHSQEVDSGIATIGILAFDRVLTSEVTAPVEVFGAAINQGLLPSYRVLLVSGTKKTVVVTEEGLKLVADATIYDDLTIDVLIVPGSYDLESVESDAAFMKFLRANGKQATWLASNCSGAFLLAHAGLLDDVRATTWAGGEADLKKSYPRVDVQFDQNVVVDGNIITSNGGAVSYQAALTLLAELSSPEQAHEIAELLQIPRLQNAGREATPPTD